jgi:hypothetical protein
MPTRRRWAIATMHAPGSSFDLAGRIKNWVRVIPSHESMIVRVSENVRGLEESALPSAMLCGLTGH